MKYRGFTTQAIHGPVMKTDAHHALQFPIYAGVAYDFESAEAMSDAFAGKRAAHVYSRISNPTVEAFEMKMAALENGLSAVAVASGMAAISTTLINCLQKGDSVVAASSLFGGTYSFLRNVLDALGIKSHFVPITDMRAVEKAIDENARVLLLETISNPGMIVPDFTAISDIARPHKVVVIADSTVTTPYLFNAKKFGVDIVIHSTTKYISGGATSVGGMIVDLGTFKWSSLPALANYHRFNEMAFTARLRKEVYRETGGCLSPHHAYLQSLGLETLALRMDRTCGNALAVAEFLETQSMVKTLRYPGLRSSSFYELSRKQFNGRFGGILTFELPDKAASFRFLNNLSLVKRTPNLGDNKTLALHPASTIFAGFTDEERKSLGVGDSMIRLSIGIEEPEDIINDIQEALRGL